jgi:hypothetical protein
MQRHTRHGEASIAQAAAIATPTNPYPCGLTYGPGVRASPDLARAFLEDGSPASMSAGLFRFLRPTQRRKPTRST